MVHNVGWECNNFLGFLHVSFEQLLSQSSMQHLAGTRATETDFLEMPSTLFERFAESELVAPLFATHYQTKEPIPLELLQTLAAKKVRFDFCRKHFAKKYSLQAFGALDVEDQLAQALLDLEIHSVSTDFGAEQHTQGTSLAELKRDPLLIPRVLSQIRRRINSISFKLEVAFSNVAFSLLYDSLSFAFCAS